MPRPHLRISSSSNLEVLVLADLCKVMIDKAGVVLDNVPDFCGVTPFELWPWLRF